MEVHNKIQIYLNSKYATTYNNGLYTSDCDYIIPTIEIPSQYQMHLSIQQASIPYSWYNVDLYNNLLVVDLYNLNNYSNDDTFSESIEIVIPTGNYNALQLASYISSSLLLNNANHNLLCTFNIITNNFQFTSTTDAFLFYYKDSTAMELFGFPKFITKNITPTVSYKSVTKNNIAILNSTTQINLSNKQMLYISSNLSTGNILMNKPNSSNNLRSVLCSIPVTSGPYTIINYINYNNFSVNTYSNVLSTINIKIMDINGNLINFNNNYYSLVLQIDLINFVD